MSNIRDFKRAISLVLAAVLFAAFTAQPRAAYAAGGPDKPKVKMLASGIAHTMAVLEDGTMMAWGDNERGQLGDGTRGNYRTSPVAVSGLNGIVAAAGGKDHSIALKSDGTVWAWGANFYGQLGTGNVTKLAEDYKTVVEDHDSAVPVQVKGLDHVTAIAAGWDVNYALKSDGTVWSWGSNMGGGLGMGAGYNPKIGTPEQIPGLSDVQSISAGWNHGHAIKKDGTAWSWGYNDSANAGDGTRTVSKIVNGMLITEEEHTKFAPVQVAGNHRFQMIAPMNNGACYALEADGTVWYWGVVLPANPDNMQYETVPVQVPGLSGVKAVYPVAAGAYVLKADGTVWTTKDSHLDFKPMNLPKISSISAGGFFHALAIAEDGSVWAWGENSKGRLGDGTETYRGKANPVKLSAFYSPELKPSSPEPKPSSPELKPSLYLNNKLSAVTIDDSKGYPVLSASDAAKLTGAKLSENKKKKTFVIARGKLTVEFAPNSLNAVVNGKPAKLKQAPLKAGGALRIPLSVLDLLGVKTKWNAAVKRADITL